MSASRKSVSDLRARVNDHHSSILDARIEQLDLMARVESLEQLCKTQERLLLMHQKVLEDQFSHELKLADLKLELERFRTDPAYANRVWGTNFRAPPPPPS